MNQNQLRQMVGALPAWQLRLMVLGALSQPASRMLLSMHESTNEPNSVWLVVAAFTISMFAFFCGFAVGFQSFSRSLQHGSNYLEMNEDAGGLEDEKKVS